jgi:hypothetical protein
MDRWQALVNALMNLPVPWNAWNFLTRWGEPIRFSRTALLHRVLVWLAEVHLHARRTGIANEHFPGFLSYIATLIFMYPTVLALLSVTDAKVRVCKIYTVPRNTVSLLYIQQLSNKHTLFGSIPTIYLLHVLALFRATPWWWPVKGQTHVGGRF